MIYEMRIYRCVSGRLPALLQRFEKVTLSLWKKHGIRQAGFWTTLIGESNHELTYLLAWESLADVMASLRLTISTLKSLALRCVFQSGAARVGRCTTLLAASAVVS